MLLLSMCALMNVAQPDAASQLVSDDDDSEDSNGDVKMVSHS